VRWSLIFFILFAAIAFGEDKPKKVPDKNRPADKKGTLEDALKRAVVRGKKHAAYNDVKMIKATAFVVDSLEDHAYLVVVEFPNMVGIFQGGYEDDRDDQWVVVEADQYSTLREALIRTSAK
jgi:hypothetical protein